MRYMLDTNICIMFAKGSSSTLLGRMQAVAPGSMVMSSITRAELAVGARSEQDDDARRLAMLGQLVPVQPFDETAAIIYGRITREHGMRRNSFDRLIAAHAVSLGTILVTNNERDFADIAGLNIENWTLAA